MRENGVLLSHRQSCCHSMFQLKMADQENLSLSVLTFDLLDYVTT